MKRNSRETSRGETVTGYSLRNRENFQKPMSTFWNNLVGTTNSKSTRAVALSTKIVHIRVLESLSRCPMIAIDERNILPEGSKRSRTSTRTSRYPAAIALTNQDLGYHMAFATGLNTQIDKAELHPHTTFLQNQEVGKNAKDPYARPWQSAAKQEVEALTNKGTFQFLQKRHT